MLESNPTYSQLLKEVILLRDEFAKMQRKYEDLLYNLDDDNFSEYLIKEKENMKTEIKFSAEGIEILSSEVFPNGVENESAIAINAREISFKVSAIDVDNKLLNYSTITQTANEITSAVVAERQYTTNLLNTDYYTKVQTNSQITQSANSITSSVSATYETKSNASSNYTSLGSRITQTENQIILKVSANYSEPINITYTPDSFSDKSRMYYSTYYQTYYYWNGSSWASASSRNIYSAFTQTASGFKLVGDFETITNANGKMTLADTYLKIYGTTTTLPKIQLGYLNVSGTDYPQFILGSGSVAHNSYGQGRDQIIMQKVVGGGNLSYINSGGTWRMIQFTTSGVDFSYAGTITGLPAATFG